MKLLILGSSLCRDLYELDESRLYTVNGTNIYFRYSFHRGKSFDYFLDNPKTLVSILKHKGEIPDIVLVILGGNSISSNTPIEKIYSKAREFYSSLKSKLSLLNPQAKIIASEIPMRFVYNNFKNTPRPEIFRNIRHRVNLKIKNIKSKVQFIKFAKPSTIS